jgi:hypothetical protein
MSEPIKESLALNAGYGDAQRLVQYLDKVKKSTAKEKEDMLAYTKDPANKAAISDFENDGQYIRVPIKALDQELTAFKNFIKYYDALVRIEQANAALEKIDDLMEYIENNAQIDGLSNLSKQIIRSENLLAASLGDVGNRREKAESGH